MCREHRCSLEFDCKNVLVNMSVELGFAWQVESEWQSRGGIISGHGNAVRRRVYPRTGSGWEKHGNGAGKAVGFIGEGPEYKA